MATTLFYLFKEAALPPSLLKTTAVVLPPTFWIEFREFKPLPTAVAAETLA
jgi:hypothetical protein